jgi:periplasmic protein TonB
MDRRDGDTAEWLRANGSSLLFALALVVLLAFGIRWIAMNRNARPPPRKVMQFTAVRVLPQPPAVKPPPPPPQPVTPPKEIDQPRTTRVELKATDIPPPDAPRPSPEPGGGRLALAAEGEGPGDAFNLAGNPGGRGLLSGGGLGDGTGDGVGGGDGAAARFGWYYVKIANEIEEAFRKQKVVNAASARVELRVWADPSGRISRVQLVRSTGDPRLDEAIQSVVGLRLREPPPRDIPMPMIARLTARRPG